MDRWLDSFLSEKGIDPELFFTVKGPSGDNFMSLSHVIDAIKNAPKHEQKAIREMLVKIDFANGDIVGYLKHLAGAIAL